MLPSKFRKQSIRGFVLMMVLVFLQIFSLTSLHSLMSETSLMRASRHQWERKTNMVMAKHILHEIEIGLSDAMPVCMTAMQSTASLTKRPLSWWKEVACSGNVNEIRYYYVVEWLAKEGCHVMVDNGINVSANYYRITLLALSNNSKGARVILQSTIAKSTGEAPLCADKPIYISLGRQFWREI